MTINPKLLKVGDKVRCVGYNYIESRDKVRTVVEEGRRPRLTNGMVVEAGGYEVDLVERDGKPVSRVAEYGGDLSSSIIEFEDGTVFFQAGHRDAWTFDKELDVYGDAFKVTVDNRPTKTEAPSIDAALDTLKDRHGLCEDFDAAVKRAKDMPLLDRLKVVAEQEKRTDLYDELVDILNPKPKVAEPQEGSYAFVRIINDYLLMWNVDSQEWDYMEGSEWTRSGISPDRSSVTVIDQGILTGKVSTKWAVGDIVPAGTVVGKQWLGETTTGFGLGRWLVDADESTIKDRRIVWIDKEEF